MTTIELSPSHPEFRNGIYGQIYDAALAVARRQQPDVAAHAEDIAMSVLERFANRNMTAQVKDPAAWGGKDRPLRLQQLRHSPARSRPPQPRRR